MDPAEVDTRVQKAKDLMLRNWKPKRPVTLAQRQKAGSGFFPDKSDATWTSQVSLTVPEEQLLRSRFLGAVNELAPQHGRSEVFPPRRIIGEWVGPRRQDQPAPSTVASERSRFEHLQSATTSPVTILYAHGGGFILGSPSFSRRGFSARIAELTGGKCFSLDYRLSPQSMFPSALYDMLLAYLALLYPNDDATIQISASSVVLAGDSAGANLCFALIQLLLHLRKSSTTVEYNGKRVELAMPAGISSISGYVDLTDCMPSIQNATFDYFRDPKLENAPDHPHDHIWPSQPPRESVYCYDEQLCHPLCSPMMAKDWIGAPPMWLCVGDEITSDSCKVIAKRAADQGVPVSWRKYERVPHVWHLLPGLERIPQTTHCLSDWADFARKCAGSSSSLTTTSRVMKARTFQVEETDFGKLLDMSFEQAQRRANDRAEYLQKLFASKKTQPVRLRL